MGVRILFLGPLSDLAGESEIEVAAPLDWEGLLGQVDAEIAQQLRETRVNIACQGRVLADKTALDAQDGDDRGEYAAKDSDGIHITVADGGQGCDGPPHGSRDAREGIGLKFVLAVVEDAGRDD